MGLVIAPIQGRYGIGTVGVGGRPSPGDGTAMSSGELAQCTSSDDTRFSSSGANGQQVWHMFKFDLTGYPEGEITRLDALHEGFTELVVPDPTKDAATNLYIWDDESSTWRSVPGGHWNQVDTEIASYWVKSDSVPYDLGRFIDSDSILWLCTEMYSWGAPYPAVTGRTDYVKIEIRVSRTVVADENLFGQRAQLFSDRDEDDLSFEIRDHPDGAYAAPTQPFAGGGNHSPAMEFLPTGAIRAVYLDSSDTLQQEVSLDDGETWSAA